jgi:hypothetical protein
MPYLFVRAVTKDRNFDLLIDIDKGLFLIKKGGNWGVEHSEDYWLPGTDGYPGSR